MGRLEGVLSPVLKKSASCQLVLQLASSAQTPAVVGDVIPTGRALGVNTVALAAWGGESDRHGWLGQRPPVLVLNLSAIFSKLSLKSFS